MTLPYIFYLLVVCFARVNMVHLLPAVKYHHEVQAVSAPPHLETHKDGLTTPHPQLTKLGCGAIVLTELGPNSDEDH